MTALKIKTNICPTCGCSLVRLGINPQEAISTIVSDNKYYFCCEGCLEVFLTNPAQFIKEVENIHVCPVCLAEKITAYTIIVTYQDLTLHFCRCPFCEETFRKTPDYFINRLKGETDFKGLFYDNESVCLCFLR